MPETDEFLAHFGIKGMKWGRRSATSTSSGQSTSESKPSVGERFAAGAKEKAKAAVDYAKTPIGARNIAATAAGAAFVAKHHEIISGTVKVSVALAKTASQAAKNERAKKFAGKMITGMGSHLNYSKIVKNAYKVTTLK